LAFPVHHNEVWEMYQHFVWRQVLFPVNDNHNYR
jgi:hypothetical protein